MNTPIRMGVVALAALVVLLAGCAGTPEAAEQPAAVQAAAEQASTAQAAQPAEAQMSVYERPGFVTEMEDGRLWVFRADSKELAEFLAKGEPAKQVIRPGAGPGGVTLKAVDSETLDEYLASVPGFVVKMEDGRLWVFRADSEELADFLAKGEPAKQVIRPGAGPGGVTIKAVDSETLEAYMAAYEAM